LNGTDVNFDVEIREQLKLAQAIQDRLKRMQSETMYEPRQFIEGETLRKDLEKKLLEFSGTTLI